MHTTRFITEEQIWREAVALLGESESMNNEYFGIYAAAVVDFALRLGEAAKEKQGLTIPGRGEDNGKQS